MADTFKFAQLQNFSLAGAGAVSGATSITLKSFKTIDGVNLAMTDFGTIAFGTLEPGNGTAEEQISFTGVTQNSNGTATLTGVSSVLFLSPYTASSGLAKTHAGSTIFVISNTSGFYDRLTGKDDDETITGLWTFVQYPQISNSAVLPTLSAQFATKAYVDSIAIAGAPKATDSVYGITRLSVAAVSPTAPIAVGDNDPRMLPTTGISGGILGWTSTTVRASSVLLTQHALIIGGGAGATPTPLASLGTTATVLHGNASGDPTFGAVVLTTDVSGILPIANGGTGSATLPFQGLYKNGTGSYQTTSGTQTVTHSLGSIPKRILIFAASGAGNNASMTMGNSQGSYDSGGQSCAYIATGNGTSSGNSSSTQAIYVECFDGTATFCTFHGIIGNVTSTTFDIVWTTVNGGNIACKFSYSVEA